MLANLMAGEDSFLKAVDASEILMVVSSDLSASI